MGLQYFALQPLYIGFVIFVECVQYMHIQDTISQQVYVFLMDALRIAEDLSLKYTSLT